MSQDPRFLSHSETSWFSKTRRCLKSGECLLFLLPLLSDRELYVDTAGILSLALTEGRLMGLASERAISLGTETRSQLMESMCVCVGLVCTALPSKSTRERPVLAVFLGGRGEGEKGSMLPWRKPRGQCPHRRPELGLTMLRKGPVQLVPAGRRNARPRRSHPFILSLPLPLSIPTPLSSLLPSRSHRRKCA